MKVQNVLVLTSEEAQDRLVNYYVQTVLNDPAHIKELILAGQPINGDNSKFIPNVSRMGDNEIADAFGEFNLGESLAELHQVPLVAVQTDDYDLKVVWDIDNVPVDQRIKFVNPNLHQTVPESAA